MSVAATLTCNATVPVKSGRFGVSALYGVQFSPSVENSMPATIPVNVLASSSADIPTSAGPSALTTKIVYVAVFPPTVTVSVCSATTAELSKPLTLATVIVSFFVLSSLYVPVTTMPVISSSSPTLYSVFVAGVVIAILSKVAAFVPSFLAVLNVVVAVPMSVTA